MSLPGVSLDWISGRLTVDGTKVKLRPAATRIIGYMLERPREILSAIDLCARLDPDGNMTMNALTVEICLARKLIEKRGMNIEILTIFKQGYVLRKREGPGDAV